MNTSPPCSPSSRAAIGVCVERVAAEQAVLAEPPKVAEARDGGRRQRRQLQLFGRRVVRRTVAEDEVQLRGAEANAGEVEVSSPAGGVRPPPAIGALHTQHTQHAADHYGSDAERNPHQRSAQHELKQWMIQHQRCASWQARNPGVLAMCTCSLVFKAVWATRLHAASRCEAACLSTPADCGAAPRGRGGSIYQGRDRSFLAPVWRLLRCFACRKASSCKFVNLTFAPVPTLPHPYLRETLTARLPSIFNEACDPLKPAQAQKGGPGPAFSVIGQGLPTTPSRLSGG